MNVRQQEKRLRRTAYGSIDDWVLLYYVQVDEAGRIEHDARRRLVRFRELRMYGKEGHRQKGREIVNCRQWRSCFVSVALHDASTLSGSSGSCLFDLVTGKAIALHFGGWPRPVDLRPNAGERLSESIFEANGAVPIWLLAADPVFDGIDAVWV